MAEATFMKVLGSAAAYCRRCDYPLVSLDRNRCPECGLAFDVSDPKTISRRPNRRRKRLLLRWGVVSLAGALFLGYLTLLLKVPCGFGYTSVCTDCGAIQHTVERRLPLTPITFSTSQTVQSTPLSSMFSQRQFRLGHVHRWSFANGGDFGLSRSCALGSGRNLYTVVNNTDVCVLVDGLIRFADAPTRDRWLKLLLDPLKAPWIEQALEPQIVAMSPTVPFADAASFNKWWEPKRRRIEEDVLPSLSDASNPRGPDR